MKRFLVFVLLLALLGGVLFIFTNSDLVEAALHEMLSRAAALVGGDRTVPITLVEGGRHAEGYGKDGSTEIPASVAGLALEITDGALYDYERLEAIYDWVTHNIEYDLEKLKDMQAYGAGAEYVLGTRKGVCHDYARLTEALLLAVGIEATYESGEVYPAPGETELHAWNHALVDGAWYALDTTWGSGIILAGEERFVRLPRRLYLASPGELQRLHRDPAYREEREQEYSLDRAARSLAEYLPDYEQALPALFNDYRASAGLPLLSEEFALTAAARQDAARLAEATIYNHDYSSDALVNEIRQRARELRIKAYCRGLHGIWIYHPFTAEELFNQLRGSGTDGCLDNPDFRSVSVGVVRKGDFTVIVCIYLEHY